MEGGVQIRVKSEVVRFLRVYVENDRLNGCLNEIELDFAEREATPRVLMKLGIQLNLIG